MTLLRLSDNIAKCQDCNFVLDTDACDHGIGAVLSQVQDGNERVIAYFSKALSRSERNYCTTRKDQSSRIFPRLFVWPRVLNPYGPRHT